MRSTRLLREKGTTLKTDGPGRGRGQSERGNVDSLQQELPSGRRTRNAYHADMFKEESSSSSSSDDGSSDGHSRQRGGRSFGQGSSLRVKESRLSTGAGNAMNPLANSTKEQYSRPRRVAAVSSSLMEARGGRQSNNHISDNDDADKDTSHQSGGLRRSGRQRTQVNSANISESPPEARRTTRGRGKVDDVDEHSESDSEDDSEEGGRKYALRDRGGIKRETMNIQQLGGDGGAYKRSASKVSRHDADPYGSRSISYKDPQARIRLGGKLPSSPDYKRSRRRHHGRGHHYKDRDIASRRHFDSSSESSSDSDNRPWRRKDRNSSFDRDPRGRGLFMSGGFGGEEDQFSRHEQHRQQRELDSIQPLMSMGGIGMGGMGMGGSVMDSTNRRDIAKADATPVGVDPTVGFHSVGGLDNHIRALKEMVVLPLLYPDLFSRFDTQPPRGVLFVGPPGTGKTLTARALVNSLSVSSPPQSTTSTTGCEQRPPSVGPTNWSNGKKVSFFMRKGADCLSKWVGEGERQLRLLFEQAKRFQPSIIFFDEIDGLAPVRSAKQDQIHASIVSTLLALMDGLDSRGQIVVIGATNRPDAIDPALRRPGRFDRELLFPLPDASARAAILDIHTSSWQPPLPVSTKEWVVQNSVGYCGADLKALCAEACLISLRRTFPQVYESSQRLQLDIGELRLGRGDFAAALQRVVPASRRCNAAPGAPLEPMSAAVLDSFLIRIVNKLGEVFPGFLLKSGGYTTRRQLNRPNADGTSDDHAQMKELTGQTKRLDDNDLWISCLTDVQEAETMRSLLGDESMGDVTLPIDGSSGSTLWSSASIVARPRLMLFGRAAGMGQTELVNAALHRLEEFPIFSLDFASLLADGGHFSPEQALVSRVMEAAKAAPSVLFLPDITSWWRSASDSMRSALLSVATGTNRSLPVLWLSTVAADRDAVCDDEGRLLWLMHWLSGSPCPSINGLGDRFQQRIDDILSNSGVVELSQPPKEAREKLFQDFFQQLLILPATILAARKKMALSRRRKLVAAPLPFVEDKAQEHRSPNTVAAVQGPVTLAELLFDPSVELPPPDLSYIDLDEARNYMRELRLFMRAALVEMFKEKKLAPLCRPVDPELVPDYYDVITAPMDLDTIRTKVDEDLYPTYRCFYYDLEQIGYNAMTYNPLDVKDYRGKQIVHAAKSLLDMVETHAYNFKDRLGYDLFKRCSLIASSPSLLQSVSRHKGVLDTAVFARALDTRVKGKADIKRVRSIMARENEEFYKDILAKHCELKEEMGEEHPSFGKVEAKLQDLEEDINSYRRGDTGGLRRPQGKDFRAGKSVVGDGSLRRSSRGRGDGADVFLLSLEDIQASNRKKRKVDTLDEAEPSVAQDGGCHVDAIEDDEKSEGNVGLGGGNADEELQDLVTVDMVCEETHPSTAISAEVVLLDAEDEEFMEKLNGAMREASEASFDYYVRAAVEASDKWQYADIMDCISELQKVCRDFQYTADWTGTIQSMEQLILRMAQSKRRTNGES